MTPSRLARTAAVAGLLAGAALAADGAETVILKDGFVIQGNVRKEVTSINDAATGKTFPVVKDVGMEMIDEGPKVVIFGTQAKQLGEVGKDTKLRPDYRVYTMPFPGRKSSAPLPAVTATIKTTDFNAKWWRYMDVQTPMGKDRIEQTITYIDPYFVYMISGTHIWRTGYRTSEMDPDRLTRLLETHPDIAQPADGPDAARMVALARFMHDAGFLQRAKDDLAAVRKAFPAGVPKDAKEAFDKLARDIDATTAGVYVREAELALGAGRYGHAKAMLDAFPEKTAEPRQIEDAARLMAQAKAARERYDAARRLLRTLIDEATGLDRAKPWMAAGGGPVGAIWPAKELAPPLDGLVAAAETVYAELHPDSAARLEVFVNLASQAEREKAQGRDPTKKPDELLATAVSGWVKGKNGATPNPASALRVWAAREAVLGFQRAGDANGRNAILNRYRKANPVPTDELAQVISLLPPAEAENLLFRSGTPVASKGLIPPGVYKRATANTPDFPGGITYQVKLPPEYHHGRAYPVLIVLTAPGVDAEQVIGSLAQEADRHGYILLAPEWANAFGKGWDWKGDDHAYVTAVLRDAVRYFCVDNDRVFLFGVADGASMAMDVGMSHPDLFAGVLSMGPSPKWANMFADYWPNAQKLPFYVVTGELAGDSPLTLKRIYENWLRRNYPGIMVVYKGRGVEWYPAEVPVMFDWMGRKTRVTPTATLKLSEFGRMPWATFRPTDNRFYWLGVDDIAPRNRIDNLGRGYARQPATIQGDIGGNNQINVAAVGVTRLSIWLGQDMIDWTKPVRVVINGSLPPGYRAKVLEPDLDVLLEDYRVRGDRRMLFMARLEFDKVP